MRECAPLCAARLSDSLTLSSLRERHTLDATAQLLLHRVERDIKYKNQHIHPSPTHASRAVSLDSLLYGLWPWSHTHLTRVYFRHGRRASALSLQVKYSLSPNKPHVHARIYLQTFSHFRQKKSCELYIHVVLPWCQRVVPWGGAQYTSALSITRGSPRQKERLGDVCLLDLTVLRACSL